MTQAQAQETPNEIAADIAAANNIETVEQARDYLMDDRSHGDEYVAHEAGHRGLWMAWKDDGDDPYAVIAFIEIALRRAANARKIDGNL